jgi:hypothetical protein
MYAAFNSGNYLTMPIEELSHCVRSAICIKKKELPADAIGRGSEFWMRRTVEILCGATLTDAETEAAIRDGFGIRITAHLMPQAARHSYLREAYTPGADNLRPLPATQKHTDAFLANAKRKWFEEDVDPFDGFIFSAPPKELSAVPRAACPRCSKRVHIYCPECVTLAPPAQDAPVPAPLATPLFTALTELGAHQYSYQDADKPLPAPAEAPGVSLPLRVDLVHHPQERITKSTGLQACLVAPAQARLIEFPGEVPAYDPATTVVLFPTEDALDIWDPALDLSQVTTAVVIEATWQKASAVIAHPNLAKLRKVRLRERVSTFWRSQELGAQFLSTLEAVYYLCVEWFERQAADGLTSAVSDVPVPERYRGGELHPTNRPGLVEGAAPTAVVETGNHNRAAVLPSVTVARTYAEVNYKGQFDDLLLIYASQHSRIHKKYRQEETTHLPRVWRS